MTRIRGWRRLAGAAWGAPNDPQFYGDLDIDAGAMLEHLRHLRDAQDTHVTVTHVVGRAVAHGLRTVPELRVRITGGREHPRSSADIFFIVSTGEGNELTGAKIQGADEKTLVELAAELSQATTAISRGSDASFGRAKRLLGLLPFRLVRPALRLSAFLTSDLNLDLPRLGMRRQSFGSAMITSVGMWGVTKAYSPLAAYYRVPVLVLVGSVTERPVAVDGAVVVRPMLTLTATFDHRYVDGLHAARFARAVRDYCVDPARFEPPVVDRVHPLVQ
jgi:pyruvate/2-oxoglutarate dehydrogenase complex dihydrolipoamide acyltransferase (E2) component